MKNGGKKMGEFLDKYGGVIVGVTCILSLIGVVTVLFNKGTDSGVGKLMKDKIDSLATSA